MSPASFRLGVASVLAGLLGSGVPAGAQDPPDVPGAYALLAFKKMEVSGPITLITGSIGVNEKDGDLEVMRVPVTLNEQDGVIAGRKVSLLKPVCIEEPCEPWCTAAAFFANTTGNGEEQCGSVDRQELPDGQPPLVRDLESSPVCSLPEEFNEFPECDASADPITVDPGPETPLRPGIYGDLTVNGGTLRLEGGNYVFCNVTTNAGSQVIAAPPSTLLVAKTFNVLPNTLINVGGSPQDLRVLVAGKHLVPGQQDAVYIAGGPARQPAFSNQRAAGGPVPRATTTCSFRPSLRGLGAPTKTTVIAQLCVLRKPATMKIFDAAILGTFVADEILVGNLEGGNTVPTTTTSTPTTSSTSTSATSTSSTSSTVTPTTSSSSTSTSPTSTSSTSATSTSSTSTSSTTGPTTSSTSISSSTTSAPPSTSVPTSTSTSSSVPVSTSTSTSSSIPTPSTTSTSLPPCYPLRLTSIRVKPRKSDPTKASLRVRGVLADAGWAGVDPHVSGVDLGVVTAAEPPSCCTLDQQFWMKPRTGHFKFWDMHRTICPPLSDMRIKVSRTGSATFRFFAPRIDLPTGAGQEVTLGTIIGNHCSLGSLSFTSLQRKKNGQLVYP